MTIDAGGRLGRPVSRHLVAVFALALLACQGERNAGAEPVAPFAEIRGQHVALEIARTRAQQQRGLGGRDGLAWHRGMLFVYAQPDFYAFWMKDMRFDIDIVWLRDGRIADIAHGVKHDPESNGPTVRPRELADAVLEVPAGYAAAHGWRRGDRVRLVLDAPGG